MFFGTRSGGLSVSLEKTGFRSQVRGAPRECIHSVARKWLRLEGRFCRRLLQEQLRLRPSEHAAHELRLLSRERQGPEVCCVDVIDASRTPMLLSFGLTQL